MVSLRSLSVDVTAATVPLAAQKESDRGDNRGIEAERCFPVPWPPRLAYSIARRRGCLAYSLAPCNTAQRI